MGQPYPDPDSNLKTGSMDLDPNLKTGSADPDPKKMDLIRNTGIYT